MKTATSIILVVILGMGLRGFLAFHYVGNYDQESYEIVAKIMERGGNVYAETSRYNYSPLWAHLLLALSRISRAFDLPFHFVVRIFLSFIDLLNSILIGLIGYKSGSFASVKHGFILYLLNPVAILIVGYHGQFETLAALPLLLAIFIYLSSGTRQLWIILVLGTLSIVIKHIFVFSVWMLFLYAISNWRRAIITFSISILVFFTTFIPYLSARGVVDNVFLYRNLQAWGITWIIGRSDLTVTFFSFFLPMLFLPFLFKHRMSFINYIQLSGVALLALMYGIGEQYFIIPILLGIASPSLWYWLYTFVATFFLMGSPNNIHIGGIPSLWVTVWIVVAGWFVSYFLLLRNNAFRLCDVEHRR